MQVEAFSNLENSVDREDGHLGKMMMQNRGRFWPALQQLTIARRSRENQTSSRCRASEEDWRSFRANLIQSELRTTEEGAGVDEKEASGSNPSASTGATSEQGLWAHPIGSRPEKGALIIARPDAFLESQRYFAEAVILLIEYSPSSGAVGLILNRPTQFTLQSLGFDITSPEDGSSSVPKPEDREKESPVNIPSFLMENRLYFGGDVKSAASTLMCLHPFDETIIPGAQKVVEGVYSNGKWFELGGEDSPAVALDARQYKFFAQYAGWSPGQLERELETSQVWIAAACSPEILLKQVIQLPKPLWREVLELMGGEYEVMSRKQYGEL